MAEADSKSAGVHYVQLSKHPIRFEPVSQLTNVFFDETNKQVFAVQSQGAMGVVVKGPDDKTNINFRMEDRGEVISIKFSYDMSVLAIQRSQKSVEFMNFTEHSDRVEYSQSCRGKTTNIIGFHWTALNEIVFVTDHGIEYYQVIPEKKTLKCLKNQSGQVNWFVWSPESAVMLLSSGPLGNIINPFHFKSGQLYKLPKFEVDLPVIPKPPKLVLHERDVTMAQIYGVLYICVLRHHTVAGKLTAEIVLYHLQRENPARRSCVLRLNMSGRFAVNLVDNIIIVHHQASKTSMLFDIKSGGESDGYVTFYDPLVPASPIRPFMIRAPSIPGQPGADGQKHELELYSPNWIVFQPNILIDAKLGYMWYLKLSLEPIVSLIDDKVKLIDFLLRRKDSKMVILKVCKQMMLPDSQASLPVIAQVFDLLNAGYREYLDKEIQAQASESTQAMDNLRGRKAIIDQSDMYTHVLSVFGDSKNIHFKFIVATLVEYIRSLNQVFIPVQHYLYELVINTLVHHHCFYQLHQFLQYHVLSDSKPLACLLLSLESVYAPAHQLALDMLKRLNTANEEIIEVLLSKHQLLSALRFIRSVGVVDTVSARKFLEAAKQTGDSMLFYTVYKFFEQRNIRMRQVSKFAPGEHCEPYVKYFEGLFGADALMPSVPS
ncbi:regulator of MON1-CCZ1 complex-like isoform X2 [Lingula anatina]|uniref:Regulator of MON1-CCZ1 complex-like isoform X2 n=1 Tax=Lingula anatina TaxID=7574 RepID=A0A1S3ID23_LINAN|nr:regulator of MON1-CCZ1 complex-like isoform X2 [Lingula anatina]|eukprot:XP_013395339.1 regulator of MON1-CCZ1 complex-like isoform X2 [Lingula anatina]